MKLTSVLFALLASGVTAAQKACPGYRATNVQQTANGLTADLNLAGPACNVYGADLRNLTLTVEYQSASRLHVIIEDQNQTVYQVPESVLPRPNATAGTTASNSQLVFDYTENPFSFSVSRSSGEVLFNTSGPPIIFESQYLRLRTSLPSHPNLYGLGEHSDHFRLNTSNYTRTLWSRDAYGIPQGTNLYGNHPVYMDHRGSNGTHGVLFLNSNGMDIKINDTAGQYLEYNTLGGVLDFYFLAGPSPIEVSQQISEVVGKPAMMAYWTFGFHQCRYGYKDVYEVAEVVHNYSAANIPLETMWTDIDYMDARKVFTLDPQRFPLHKMRELVTYLHAHQQHYIVMVDPAVAYQNYSAFNNGNNSGVFMKRADGSVFEGVVWPGPTVFPDWFHPDTQDYWNGEFASFFSPETGVDISGLWIDMNEASNFCNYPCSNPSAFAKENGFPPKPAALRNGPAIALPGFPPDFQPPSNTKRQAPNTGDMLGLPGRKLINPPYMIQNAAGSLSNKTLNTDLVHYNGLVEYDTHNLYGTMMSSTSRGALLNRRPGERPLVITRSTFLGAGAHVGHWTGDNVANWDQYEISISDMLNFASIFQLPMVGSDVCGYSSNSSERLCARWMMLGAFQTFYRNHNELGARPQEAYRWPITAQASRNAIDIRYRALDYLYTAFWTQTQNGKPVLNPMFYLYPEDTKTFGIDAQFFFGDSMLVSPVTGANKTTVRIYLPDDIFYDWNDGFSPVRGNGSMTTLTDVNFTTIPLHVRGGAILPLRVESTNTTAELRTKGFHLLIAPGTDGAANGSLYLDDGLMIEQPGTTLINFTYTNGAFSMSGDYTYPANVSIERITICGVGSAPQTVNVPGAPNTTFSYDNATMAVTIHTSIPLTQDASFQLPASQS
ncbi:alpha/beta-glucosidase agdC [Cladophialophora psammophila CBS 110553]|uniref:Probable alpha/beta-glucosidase agdC n=1 Tax=Cladophialophora psammophila CBS 110553 TaxID=1182543 RepID=W9X8K5_9EURO|nr:alpha/beta-glucosidase agdC [Cladophialophora psammophila CBS 110553]EXJ66764.1 alpha/beta-glucosidase agdC [Cladophialophora psammophila CBS 110553]